MTTRRNKTPFATPARARALLLAVAVSAAIGAPLTQPRAQQGEAARPAAAQPTSPAPGAPEAPPPFASYPMSTVIGSHGYFEVTPAGSLVFYPVWTAVDPAVMQTIFAMMGATSLVGQRGHYQVGSDGQVRFYLPPGTTPGYFDPRLGPPPGYGAVPGPGLSPGPMQAQQRPRG